jgi:glutaminyl-tRNA synthetase
MPFSSPAPEVIKDENTGESLNCAAPTTRPPAAAMPRMGARSKATLHWVSAQHALDAEVRLYDRLFTKEPTRTKRPTAKPLRISSIPIPW